MLSETDELYGSNGESNEVPSNSTTSLEAPTKSATDALSYDDVTKTVTISGDCTRDEIYAFMHDSGPGAAAEIVHFSQSLTITSTNEIAPTQGAFQLCNSLNKVTATPNIKVVIGADTGKTATIKDFFGGCSNLTSIEGLANWDVSQVSGDDCMTGVFFNCSSLTSLAFLSSWNVSNVTGQQAMWATFQGCSSLTSLEGLASWDVTNLEGVACLRETFANCTNLQSIEALASWNLTKAKANSGSILGMFNSDPNITYIKGAPTDPEGFVPTSRMRLTTLSSSNNWYSDTNPTTAVSGDTLLANWADYADEGAWTWKHTVSFDTQGGTGGPTDVLVAHLGEVAFPETEPTRSGYNFAGWYKDSTYTEPWDFYTNKVDADTVLYARWSTDPVSLVSFDTQGGTPVMPQWVIQGQKVTRPATDPVRADSDFDNWYTTKDGDTLFDFDTEPAASLTIYAHWFDHTLPLTFDGNGGVWGTENTVVLEASIPQGTVVLPTQDPVYTGYIFLGYYTQREGGEPVSLDTALPAEPAIYYAHWTEALAPTPAPGANAPAGILPITGDASHVNENSIFSLVTGIASLLAALAGIGITRSLKERKG